jgi:hypothetical protein
MKNLLLFLSAFVFFVSCAKNRGVDPLRNEVTKDWLPKSAFLGTRSTTRDAYYSKITVVKNTLDGGFVFAGYQSDMRVGYFEFTEDKLQFKSVQGAYRGRESSLTAEPILYQWPITHHQAELQEVDGKTINKEIDDDRKKWFEKSQFKPDFGAPDLTEENTFFRSESRCWKVASRRRLENSVQIEPGYISFVVEVLYNRNCADSESYISGHSSYMAQYRYSFRKVEESDYEPMVYAGEQDPRMRKFGYFQSIKEELVNGEKRNLFLVNRWHPKKKHYFYYTKDFPQKYKYIFEDIFKKTNQVFEKKGLEVRFLLHENDFDPASGQRTGVPKEFGDLRYSFINLIEEIDPSAPLGYGPSDADPFTGEIIAANLNVWSGMITTYLRRLEQSYFRNADEKELLSKSKWEVSTLYSEMGKLLEQEDPKAWTQDWSTPRMLDIYNKMAEHTVYTYPGWNSFTTGSTLAPVEVVVDRPVRGAGYQESILGITGLLDSKGIQEIGVSQNISDYLNSFKVNQPQIQSVRPRIIDYQPLEDMPLNKALPKELQRIDLNVLKEITLEMNKYEQREMHNVSENLRGHCKLSTEATLAGVEQYMIYGFTTDQIAENIIYRTSIHELGHNLNLRHNFYGSVDKKNFLKPSIPKFLVEFEKDEKENIIIDEETNRPKITGNKIPVIDPQTGKQEMWPTVSSSVMDYLRLQDEFFTTQEWEPYDIAALAYAYSDGKIDDQKGYLFCTDEHTVTSAICNRFDRGSTPSEIMMSFIDTYEDGYYTRNYRFNRQYWDTSGYMGAIIGLMKEMKEFLPMWRTAFYPTNIKEVLKKKGISDKYETDEIITNMDREMKQSIRLALAFYQAVLLQKDTDKPFRSVYELGTGALQRMGIANDKMVAMYFMAGDDQIFYNPNRVLLFSSYMSYMYEPEFASIMDKIMENIVTQRVDMEPWFISFGRQLYAQSAMNFSNRENESLINKIKIKRFTILELEEYFNYKFENENDKVANLVTLETSKDFDFKKGEEVAIVGVNANYYMFSKQDSPYAFDIYKGIKQQEEFENPTVEGKLDLQELFYIYTIMSGGSI